MKPRCCPPSPPPSLAVHHLLREAVPDSQRHRHHHRFPSSGAPASPIATAAFASFISLGAVTHHHHHPHRPVVLLLLAVVACCCWWSPPPLVGAQEVPEFMLSRKDIVDKNVEASETVLSPNDFANIPEKEVDLRKLGIHVSLDPTMGNKVEGDIVGWAPPKGVTGSSRKGQQQQPMMMVSKRNKNNVENGGGGMDDDESSPVAGGDGGAKKPQKKQDGGQVLMFDENGLARNSIRQPYRRWPHNEIPYAVSAQYGSYSRSVIAKAISEYHSKTCVRFVPRDVRKHTDYVWIHPDDGCYSLVGRTGGRQPLSLDSGCIQVGTIVHELMHAVGFFHEQSRYDRDSYIQILWSNVLRGADDQFEKYSYTTIDQLGEPYDYGSIMHYGPYAFSSNGKRTIVPRRTGSNRMGQRVSFSETDLRKINKLYQCEHRPTNTITTNNNRANGNNRNWGHQQQVDDNDGAASSGDSQPTPAAPVPSSTVERCEDQNWRCLFWSMPVLHYCARSEVIRTEVCPLSCGTCTPPPLPLSSTADDDDNNNDEETRRRRRKTTTAAGADQQGQKKTKMW